ncbi:MAG: single-stranded-DNA-specific exonuclease RecJ [Pseudomonadota bacterium]
MSRESGPAVETGPDDADRPLLGVARSLRGQRWQARAAEPHMAEALAQAAGLPDIVGRVMAARGVSLEAAASFLNPSLRDSLPDPDCLADMALAAQRLAQAVMAGEPVVVFGDYDVDGATSSALLLRYVRGVGGRISAYIPDRLREGYGPNAPALEKLARAGARLVLTVDCGTQAHAALAAGRAAGLDILVIDHHKVEATLPPATAIINPNRLDDRSGLGHLAAVGVAFLLLVAVNRHLRGAGWFGPNRPEPDLLALLDLVALGTVCDVVPLIGLNRAFVHQGLKVLAGRRNIGLRALADVAGLDERPSAYHLGFLLGPRVNAGGRVGKADLGTLLLATEDEAEAQAIARHLDALNCERQALEAVVLEAALAQAGAPEGAPLVMVAAAGWHPGVIGIVASRLKERFQRPALVIGIENGVGKGSGRSMTGVDLGAAVIAARGEGLLVNGGGHAMAAGLTVAEDKIPALREFLIAHLALPVSVARQSAGLQLDGALSLSGATVSLIETLEAVGPFGVGNPAPRFAIPDCTLVAADLVGRDHVRMILAQADGARIKAMAFREGDTAFGQSLLTARGRRLHVAGKLKRDDWGAVPKAELHLDDAAFAD